MPRKITLFFSEVVDLYNKIPPARPTNNTRTAEITLSSDLLFINGLKTPASNVKNITKQMYLKPDFNCGKVLLIIILKFDYQINF